MAKRAARPPPLATVKKDGKRPVPESVSFDTEAGRRAQGIDTDYRNIDKHRPRRRMKQPTPLPPKD